MYRIKHSKEDHTCMGAWFYLSWRITYLVHYINLAGRKKLSGDYQDCISIIHKWSIHPSALVLAVSGQRDRVQCWLCWRSTYLMCSVLGASCNNLLLLFMYGWAKCCSWEVSMCLVRLVVGGVRVHVLGIRVTAERLQTYPAWRSSERDAHRRHELGWSIPSQHCQVEGKFQNLVLSTMCGGLISYISIIFRHK